jgi:hypothetical protein
MTLCVAFAFEFVSLGFKFQLSTASAVYIMEACEDNAENLALMLPLPGRLMMWMHFQ